MWEKQTLGKEVQVPEQIFTSESSWVGSCGLPRSAHPCRPSGWRETLLSPCLWQTLINFVSSPGLSPQDQTFLSKRDTPRRAPCRANSVPNTESKTHTFPLHTYQIFSFLCFMSRGKMAEDQPHLCIQMSESSTNGIPSRMQSLPDLAGRVGSVLTFHKIYYHVTTKTGFLCFQKATKKEVLRDVKYVFKHLIRVCVSFISVWKVDFTHVIEPFSTICRPRFRKIICMCGCFMFAVICA